MTWFNKSFTGRTSDEKIQDEIRRRILEEAQKREAIRESRDATRATLDALEEIVSLPREEMERIAEQVKAEFRGDRQQDDTASGGEQRPAKPSRPNGSLLPWILAALVVLSFFGFRRGHPWMLAGGVIVLVLLVVRLFDATRK